MNHAMSRRTAVKRLVAGTATIAASTRLKPSAHAADIETPAPLRGNIHHSACRWCYKGIPLDDLCAAAKSMGIESIDLVGPDDFDTLKRHGLICAMVGSPTVNRVGGIARGFNRTEHHEALVQGYEAYVPQVAKAGFPNVICFSGNRGGLDDEQGLENCALGLQQIMPLAERHRVTICMELLNSKRNHKDYQCDHTAWGAELCRRVGSERFKLLYDIYHMQIMEGDVIATLRENKDYIGHYHTGGVPGRHEIDDTQELNYPAIMRAIVGTGYSGYVAQEFIPSGDPLVSLRQAVVLCDV